MKRDLVMMELIKYDTKHDMITVKKLLTCISIFFLCTCMALPTFAQSWTVYNESNSKLPRNGMASVEVDGNGVVWAGSANSGNNNPGGLVRLENQNMQVFQKSNSGLPFNIITDIATSGSAIWVSGFGGVSKYDGNSWESYSPNNSNIPSIRIFAIHVVSNGNVWAGSFSSGAAEFNGNSWSTYTSGNSGLPSDSAVAITSDGSGNLWMNTFGSGTVTFDGSNWTTFNTGNSSLPSNDTNLGLTIDGAGNIWVGTFNGLAQYDGSNWTAYNKANSGLPSDSIARITVGNTGNIWIGTYNGLVKYDGNNWTVFNTANSNIPGNLVNDVAVDNNGNIWVTTANNGLAKYGAPTSISESPSRQTALIKAYPTPAQSKITLKSKKSQIANFKFQTLTGQTVKTGQLDGKGSHTLDVSHMSTGVYLLQVRSDEGVVTKKVMVE